MAHTNIISIIFLFSHSPALQSPNANNFALNPDRSSVRRSGLLEDYISSKWPMGVIPYFVDNKCYDFIISYKIRMAMNIIETASCIQFDPLHIPPNGTLNSSWIHIKNPTQERECTHELQHMDHGEIILVLGYDCLHKDEILHSILHAIGFKDEVTHPYRDKYLRVLWGNIQPAYRKLYHIRADIEPANLVEYDPLSVMHFGDRDFSINGHATVEAQLGGMVINPSETLSQLDKMKLSLFFGHLCNKREVKNILKTCKNTFRKEVDNNISKEDKKQGLYELNRDTSCSDTDTSGESDQNNITISKKKKKVGKDYIDPSMYPDFYDARAKKNEDTQKLSEDFSQNKLLQSIEIDGTKSPRWQISDSVL